MLLPNINTILNMDIEDIIYPGFNRSLSELNAITKLKKKSCEHGLENVYIVDSSTFPRCSGVNPMISIQSMSHFLMSKI